MSHGKEDMKFEAQYMLKIEQPSYKQDVEYFLQSLSFSEKCKLIELASAYVENELAQPDSFEIRVAKIGQKIL